MDPIPWPAIYKRWPGPPFIGDDHIIHNTFKLVTTPCKLDPKVFKIQ
jgi:hypothetical protein